MESTKESTDKSQKKRPIFAGITANVVVLSITSFLTDFSTELFYPLLPVFLTTVLGASKSYVGLIEGVAETTASLLKLLSGWLSDKLNRRKALVICGYGLSGLTRPLIAISTMGWHVLGARFIDRIGKGFRTSPRDALIADSTSPEHRGKAFGFHRSMDHAGAVVGPLTAFIIMAVIAFGAIGENFFTDLLGHPHETLTIINNSKVEEHTYRIVFWFASIPAILSILVLAIFVKDIRRNNEVQIKLPVLTLKPFNRNFKLFLPILILFTLGNSSDAFLLLRAKDLGVATVFVPILWVVLHIVKMISSMPGSAWSDKVGRRKAIAVGWLIYSIIYFGFAYSKTEWHIWVLFALYGIYFGLTEGTEKAFVADLVPSELRGTAYGVYNFAIGIGAFPASVIMGKLWDSFVPTVAFGFGSVISLLAMILLILLMPARINVKEK
jgi:MFS family permease